MCKKIIIKELPIQYAIFFFSNCIIHTDIFHLLNVLKEIFNFSDSETRSDFILCCLHYQKVTEEYSKTT